MKKTKSQTTNPTVEVIGWYGPVALLLAFALVSWGNVAGRSYLFQILNLTGGIALAMVSIAKRAHQPAVLNIIFSLIALITIMSMVIKGY